MARRFPYNSAILIKDYTDDELIQIFRLNCKIRKYKISSWEVEEKVLEVLRKQRVLPNFGNASSVEMVMEAAVSNAALRFDTEIEIRPEDVHDGDDDDDQDPLEDPLADLSSMYKMEKIHSLLTEMLNFLKVTREEGYATPHVGHFVFRQRCTQGHT